MSSKKAEAVRIILESSLKVADFRCSLFIAALLTYRKPTTLKPFPSFYTCNGTKQFDRLIEVIKKIPPLKSLIRKLNDLNYIKHNQDIIDLLHFILIDTSEPYLSCVSNDSIDSILKKVPSDAEVCKPQFIFEVIYPERSQTDAKWRSYAEEGKTFYAYHGSKLENFHSILHHGLQQHMSKTMLFGSGTYLSSELSVCLLFSPSGLCWENSCLGQTLSCVALCELLDSPNGITRQNTKLNDVDGSSRSKTKASDSMAGEIPHKYYIVHNDDLVRVKYLLVYAQQNTSKCIKSNGKQSNFIKKWISQYKFLTVMMLYIAILIVIGLRNNDSFNYYYKVLTKKVSSNAFL